MTYWHYTFQKIVNNKNFLYGVGTQSSEGEEFDFAGYYRKHPDFILLSVNKISKEQYKELNRVINKENYRKMFEL